MCKACGDAIVRIMTEKVLERRAAVATASESDRRARQRDLAAAERALLFLAPADLRYDRTCPFSADAPETVHQPEPHEYAVRCRPSGRLGGRFVWRSKRRADGAKHRCRPRRNVLESNISGLAGGPAQQQASF
jgi:hypothetical protein